MKRQNEVPSASRRPGQRGSIWAFLCAVLALLAPFTLGIWVAIPAVICGHAALRDIRRHPGRTGRRSALDGLVLGYVIIAVGVVGGLYLLHRRILERQATAQMIELLDAVAGSDRLAPSER